MTRIGACAFEYCFGLAAVTLPESLKEIDLLAFAWNDSLTSITIPAGVTGIGADVFSYCSALKNIYFCGDAPVFGDGERWEEWYYNVFFRDTLTAYYPADNDTWTEEVRQDYGGKITWIPCQDSKPVNPFGDVQEGRYYYNPVLWAYYNGVTNGTSDTSFSPNNTCTRGQVVTFLWNAFGKPEPTTTTNPFVDVQEGRFYYKAVLWALEKGITNGVDATHFNPNGPCTRGQVVTFIWNAYGKPDPTIATNPFVDVKEGRFYTKAVLWAVENGITNGTDATHFSPDKTCTRGQVVTFLYNAMAD